MIQENESEGKVIAIDPAAEPSVTVITVKKGMFEFLYGIRKVEEFTAEEMDAIRERIRTYTARYSVPNPLPRMHRLTPNQQMQFLNVDYAEIEKRILATMATKDETLQELLQ